MPTSVDSGVAAQIKDLAQAVSTQAQVSNSTWKALMTVAVITLLPRTPTLGTSSELDLPFGFGKVDAQAFYFILFSLLVVLTIAFAAAHAQQVRAQKLAQEFVDSCIDSAEFGNMHPRELFDMFRLPSLNRVAPLAQMLRGPYQFYRTAKACPVWLRIVSVIYYILLKLTSWAVYFGVPALAVLYAYYETQLVWFPWHVVRNAYSWFIFVAGTTAMLTLLHVFLNDVFYSVRVVRQIW